MASCSFTVQSLPPVAQYHHLPIYKNLVKYLLEPAKISEKIQDSFQTLCEEFISVSSQYSADVGDRIIDCEDKTQTTTNGGQHTVPINSETL